MRARAIMMTYCAAEKHSAAAMCAGLAEARLGVEEPPRLNRTPLQK